MASLSLRYLVLTLVALTIVLGGFAYAVPNVSAQVTQVAGLQVGAENSLGPWSCNRSPFQFWGNKVYAPNITGGWSSVAKKAACIEWMVFWNQNMGQQDWFKYLKVYLAKKQIPAETDIRVCIEENNGSSYGGASCTPWASEAADENAWLDSGDTAGGNDPDGLRIKIESRPLPGRSVLDMQVRSRMKDWCAPNGALNGYRTVTSEWATSKWRSALAGTGEWSTTADVSGCTMVDSAQVGLRVRMSSWNVSDMTATIADHGVLTLGVPTAINYSIGNIGNVSTGVTQAELRFDYKRDGWDGNGIDGDFSIQQVIPVVVPFGTYDTSAMATFNDEGNWRVQVVSDSLGTVTEANETNNASVWDDFVVDAVPVVTLTAQKNGVGAWSPTDLNIEEGDQVQLAWTSNADACTSLEFNTSNQAFGTGVDMTEPNAGNSTTVTLTCTTVNGLQGQDSLTVTTNAPTTPVVTLEVESPSNSWTSNDVAILLGEVISLRWNAPNDVDECTSVGFSLAAPDSGNDINGQKGNITPVAGGTTYRYLCRYGTGPWGTAELTVTANSAGPSLQANTTRARRDEVVTLTWNTNGNDPTTCSLEGANLSQNPLTLDPLETTGMSLLTVVGTSNYVLTCPGGSATVTINLIQQVFES